MQQVKMQYLPASPVFLLARNSRMIGLLQRPAKFAESPREVPWMYFPRF